MDQMVEMVASLTEELRRMNEKYADLEYEKNIYLKILEELREVDEKYKSAQIHLIRKMEDCYEKKHKEMAELKDILRSFENKPEWSFKVDDPQCRN